MEPTNNIPCKHSAKRSRICDDCCDDQVKRRFCITCRMNDLNSIKAALAKNAQAKNNIVYFSVDIEKVGPRFTDGVISVGFVIADLYSGPIIRSRVSISLRPNIDTIDPKCMKEFWKKHPEVLKKIVAEGIEHNRAMLWISHWLVDLEDAAKSINARIELVTNNPLFDLGHIDYSFSNAEQMPIRYSRSGDYLTINDPNERLRALGLYCIEGPITKKLQINTTHMPDDDAEKMFWQLVITFGATNLLRSGDVTYNQIKKRFEKFLEINDILELKQQLLTLARWW